MGRIVLCLAAALLLVKPLGAYMACVYQGERTGLDRLVSPLERLLYRLCRIDPTEEMTWQTYAASLILFTSAGLLFLYALERLQGVLPLNPSHMPAVPPELSLNTAVSFATNTNWQNYGGESTLSYLTQMAGLTVKNFVSAAAGLAVMVALIRGLARQSAQTVGNVWTDIVRGVLYILLPLSIILALALVSQGSCRRSRRTRPRGCSNRRPTSGRSRTPPARRCSTLGDGPRSGPSR